MTAPHRPAAVIMLTAGSQSAAEKSFPQRGNIRVRQSRYARFNHEPGSTGNVRDRVVGSLARIRVTGRQATYDAYPELGKQLERYIRMQRSQRRSQRGRTRGQKTKKKYSHFLTQRKSDHSLRWKNVLHCMYRTVLYSTYHRG